MDSFKIKCIELLKYVSVPRINVLNPLIVVEICHFKENSWHHTTVYSWNNMKFLTVKNYIVEEVTNNNFFLKKLCLHLYASLHFVSMNLILISFSS